MLLPSSNFIDMANFDLMTYTINRYKFSQKGNFELNIENYIVKSMLFEFSTTKKTKKNKSTFTITLGCGRSPNGKSTIS